MIMYADTITGSMQTAIDETTRRRARQVLYNEEHGIVPETVKKSKEAIMEQTKVADSKKTSRQYYVEDDNPSVAADPVVAYMDTEGLEKMIQQTQKNMESAAKELDFIEAARLRDELFELQKLMKEKS